MSGFQFEINNLIVISRGLLTFCVSTIAIFYAFKNRSKYKAKKNKGRKTTRQGMFHKCVVASQRCRVKFRSESYDFDTKRIIFQFPTTWTF